MVHKKYRTISRAPVAGRIICWGYSCEHDVSLDRERDKIFVSSTFGLIAWEEVVVGIVSRSVEACPGHVEVAPNPKPLGLIL